VAGQDIPIANVYATTLVAGGQRVFASFRCLGGLVLAIPNAKAQQPKVAHIDYSGPRSPEEAVIQELRRLVYGDVLVCAANLGRIHR